MANHYTTIVCMCDKFIHHFVAINKVYQGKGCRWIMSIDFEMIILGKGCVNIKVFYILWVVLVCFLMLWYTPLSKATYEGKGLFDLMGCNLSLRKAKAETRQVIKIETRVEPRLLLLSSSACFSIQPMCTHLGMVWSIVDWGLIHQSSIKTVSHRSIG